MFNYAYSQSFKVGNTKIKVRVFKSLEEQRKGLGGIKNKDFSAQEAGLFLYKIRNKKRFWMLNTFFNLDIFFLDKNFKIIQIDRNLKFHKGFKNQNLIQRSKDIICTHVLEMRADSKYSKQLKIGDTLLFNNLAR